MTLKMTSDPDTEAQLVRRRSAVSARDVARAAGVSSATVSYVFNARRGVSQTTREHVRSIADSLGYNRPVRALEPRTLDVLGLALSNVANPFYPELSVAFCEAAARRGFGVFLAHTDDDDYSASTTVRSMIERGVDGIAIAVARSDSAEVVRDMRRGRLPFVQISRAYAGGFGDFVGVDDVAAARQIAAHAMRHERVPIATVIGSRTSSASAQRERGFLEQLRASGIDVPAEYRVSAPLTLEGGRAAAAHLLALPSPPRFMLCGSDVLALGVMTEAQVRGLSVPGDVAVTGFDGIEICSTEMIRLTGIVQPHVEMARQAVDLLIDRVEGRRATTTRMRIPHTLRIGRTCGCNREEKED